MNETDREFFTQIIFLFYFIVPTVISQINSNSSVSTMHLHLTSSFSLYSKSYSQNVEKQRIEKVFL